MLKQGFLSQGKARGMWREAQPYITGQKNVSRISHTINPRAATHTKKRDHLKCPIVVHSFIQIPVPSPGDTCSLQRPLRVTLESLPATSTKNHHPQTLTKLFQKAKVKYFNSWISFLFFLMLLFNLRVSTELSQTGGLPAGLSWIPGTSGCTAEHDLFNSASQAMKCEVHAYLSFP